METNEMRRNRLSNLLQKADIFPLQMGFTHSSMRTYKSATSGVFSVITLLSILSFFCFLLVDIRNFKVSLKNSIRKRDLIFDNTSFDLSDQNFDFAVNVQYLGRNQSRSDKIHRFISLHVMQNVGYWDKSDNGTKFLIESTSIPLEKCTDSAFNSDTKYLNKLGIVGNYFCPTVKNFNLSGSMQNDRSDILSISMLECDQKQLDILYPGEVCADLAEQQEVASQVMFQLVITNQYFAGENKEEPIQNDYKMMALGVPLQQSFYTYVKYSVNYAILEDSWLFESFQAKNVSYSSIRVDNQYGRAQQPYNPSTPYVIVILVLDENVDINERTAYNLVMVLQSIGGFASVCMVISKVLFHFVQQYNYYGEILSLLYSETSQEDSPCQVDPFENTFRRLNSVSGRDPEIQLSKNESLIDRLSHQVFASKPPRFGFWNFLTMAWKNGSIKSKVLKEGHKLLQNELSLQGFVKKMRMLELFFSLQLTPFQQNIIRAVTSKRVLSNGRLRSNEDNKDSLFSDDLSTPEQLKRSLKMLVDASQGENASRFDRKLAEHLGLSSQSISENDRKKENSQVGERNVQLKVAQKKPQLGFKKQKIGGAPQGENNSAGQKSRRRISGKRKKTIQKDQSSSCD